MPAAPAARAFSAPRTVMMPLSRKGFSAHWTMVFSSSTVLLPAGGLQFFRKGRPAASMSMAMAKGFAAWAAAIFSRMSSMFQGFTVGTPQPSCAPMAWRAEAMTEGSTPSPVKAAMPASRQAGTRMSL